MNNIDLLFIEHSENITKNLQTLATQTGVDFIGAIKIACHKKFVNNIQDLQRALLVHYADTFRIKILHELDKD